MTLTKTFWAAIVAIVLGTSTALLTAAAGPGAPLEGSWIVAPLVGGITGIATLIKVTFRVEPS